MKTIFTNRALSLALGLAAALALASCASPIERRIVSNPQIYEKLSGSDQGLVSHGEIREGMTKEAVFLALGRPDHVAEGRDRGAPAERWTYVSERPVTTTSIGLGWGAGRWAYGGGFGYGYGGLWDPYWGGYGSGVAYVPYQSEVVEFRGGRVVKYIRERE
jgi:hypothetical protein